MRFLRNVLYFSIEAFKNIFTSNFMSFMSFLMTIVSITMLGIFDLVKLHLGDFSKKLENRCKISAYASQEIDEFDLQKTLREIKRIKGVKNVEIVTKEEAFSELKDMFKAKSSLIGTFERDNPLRDSYKITLEDPNLIEEIATEVSKLNHVENVNYEKNATKAILELTYFIKFLSLFFTYLFSIISILIISNTIKMVIFTRRKEISIMKFVGATNWFIRWPYILEGSFVGATGAIAAFLFLMFGYKRVLNSAIFSCFTSNLAQSTINFEGGLFLKLLFSGFALGCFGSFVSVSKHLKV